MRKERFFAQVFLVVTALFLSSAIGALAEDGKRHQPGERRSIGGAAAEMGRSMGRAGSKFGRNTGHGFKEFGKGTGHCFAEFGKGTGHFFKGFGKAQGRFWKKFGLKVAEPFRK